MGSKNSKQQIEIQQQENVEEEQNSIQNENIINKPLNFQIQRSITQIQENINTNQQIFGDDEKIDITIKTKLQKDKVIQNTQLQLTQSNIKPEDCIQLAVKGIMKQESQILPVLASLKTTQINEENQFKPGIDIICVIDTSGSMIGEKIELVRKALKSIVDLLSENDRFCLISFESSAARQTPLARINEKNKLEFYNKFQKLIARGGTNINSGIELALKTLKYRKIINHVSSIFLLSDGQDDSAELQIKNSLAEFNIQEAFTLHTFGFGNDHDGILMKAISNLKDGNFYYIETLDIVNECFVDALGGLISVIAQKVKLTCKLIKHPIFSDMRINKAYGNWKYNEQNQEYSLVINQLFGGITKDNILEINIPPLKKNLTQQEKYLDILNFIVEYQEIEEETKIKKIETSLKIQFFNSDENFQQDQADQETSINHLRVIGAFAMVSLYLEQANAAAAQYQNEIAQKILDDAIKLIVNNQYSTQLCLTALVDDLKKSKIGCEQKNYQSFGQTMMLSKTNIFKVHMNQRASPMQSNEVYSQLESQNLYCNTNQIKLRSQARQSKQ